jgi:hypothetical protein
MLVQLLRMIDEVTDLCAFRLTAIPHILPTTRILPPTILHSYILNGANSGVVDRTTSVPTVLSPISHLYPDIRETLRRNNRHLNLLRDRGGVALKAVL